MRASGVVSPDRMVKKSVTSQLQRTILFYRKEFKSEIGNRARNGVSNASQEQASWNTPI
jgi:hypothetical protein